MGIIGLLDVAFARTVTTDDGLPPVGGIEPELAALVLQVKKK